MSQPVCGDLVRVLRFLGRLSQPEIHIPLLESQITSLLTRVREDVGAVVSKLDESAKGRDAGLWQRDWIAPAALRGRHPYSRVLQVDIATADPIELRWAHAGPREAARDGTVQVVVGQLRQDLAHPRELDRIDLPIRFLESIDI